MYLGGADRQTDRRWLRPGARRGFSVTRLLQHGQERGRLHVGDPDLVLVLGQFPVEHGVEHGAADSQDVLPEQRETRLTAGPAQNQLRTTWTRSGSGLRQLCGPYENV